MEKQKAVAPTVYQFRAPERPKLERQPEEPKVISGVHITNKIQPKQGIPRAAETPIESSFLIANVKRKEPTALAAEAPAEQEEEGQGFPYDDTEGQETEERQGPESPTAPIVLPLSPDPKLAVRQQAREKVQGWVRAKAEQRSRELREVAAGYKK